MRAGGGWGWCSTAATTALFPLDIVVWDHPLEPIQSPGLVPVRVL